MDGWWRTATVDFHRGRVDGLAGRLLCPQIPAGHRVLGRILDPFVDKVIICGSFIFLLGVPQSSGVTAWMTLIIVGREMFITNLRVFLERRGVDFSAKWSGKIKMGVQCHGGSGVALLSLSPEFQAARGMESDFRQTASLSCAGRDPLGGGG